MRTKGAVERQIRELNLTNYSIFRPGLIEARDGDFRYKEVFLSYIPFVKNKITAKALGQSILEHTIIRSQPNSKKGEVMLDNAQILA